MACRNEIQTVDGVIELAGKNGNPGKARDLAEYLGLAVGSIYNFRKYGCFSEHLYLRISELAAKKGRTVSKKLFRAMSRDERAVAHGKRVA